MKRVATIDFETYYSSTYSLSLPEYNTSSYIRDPQFKAHCVAIKIDDKPTKCFPAQHIERELRKIDWSKTALLAHNTHFDGFIMAERYDIYPTYYYDTVSQTRGLHSELTRASLAKIAQYYGLRQKSTTYLTPTRGLRDLPPKILDGLMEGCILDNDLCREVFNKQIAVYPEEELDLIDRVIKMFCNSPLLVDVKLARTALAWEIMEKRHLILRVDVPETDLQSNQKFAKLLEAEGVEPPTKTSGKTGMESFAFAQTDPEFIALLEHEDLRVRQLVEARLAAKSTQTETRAYRLIQAGENGQRLPVGYNYYAAKTGRLGGTNKLNLQNLTRVDPKEPKPSDGLRRSIMAPPGHVLVVADRAQIEARVNGWQAGDTELLHVFATKGDPYVDMAKDIYGRPIIKEKDKLERFVGKTAVLGLGYQMGHKKFQTTLAAGTNGPAVFLDLGTCARIVNLYRGKRHKIAKSWETARHILQKMSMGQEGEWGCLTYDATTIWLPNGMGIHYPGLHYNGDQYKFNSNGVWCKVYGGLVIENVVQALARIIAMSQMLKIQARLEKEVILKPKEVAKIVMLTHDEDVACVPTRYAKPVQKIMLEEMRKPPAWCSDIPLDAESSYARNYSK